MIKIRYLIIFVMKISNIGEFMSDDNLDFISFLFC